MYLTKEDALELYELGFEVYSLDSGTYPLEVYDYNNEEWCAGGKILHRINKEIFFANEILVSDQIYEEGLYLPNDSDLMDWLENNDFTFEIKSKNGMYKVVAWESEKNKFRGGGTFTAALRNVIIKILKSGFLPKKKSEVVFLED